MFSTEHSVSFQVIKVQGNCMLQWRIFVVLVGFGLVGTVVGRCQVG